MSFYHKSHQSKKEEYEINEKATRIYKVITNEPKSPDSNLIEKLKKLKEDPFYKFSIDDYDLICKNQMMKRMMARALNTEVSKLNAICKKMHILKKYIESSPITIKKKIKAKTSPIKDLAPELLSFMSAKAISLRDLPDHLLERIINEDVKPLLKYELMPCVPLHRIDWSLFSLNPKAIDYLSLPENKKRIDYSQLSKNINPNAIELLKVEIMKNPNNPNIDWCELSGNPNAIEILDVNRDKIEWADFAGNTSPKTIQIIKEDQLDIASRGYYRELHTYWYTISRNTSTEAIDFLSSPENYHKIFWDFLSANTNLKAIEMLIVKESEEYDLEDADFNRLKTNQKISWANLSKNPEAISLLKNKWEDEKVLQRSDIKQYKLLKKKEYIVHWNLLSGNPNAIDLLREKIVRENNLEEDEYDSLEVIEKIDWVKLSANQKAIKLLEENPAKIDWRVLSKNPKAIKLLKKELKENPNRCKIDWSQISQNPEAIEILDKNRDKIVWPALSENPNAGEIVKDRIEFENKIPKKTYNEIPQQNKLNWTALSKNPAIFTIT